MPIPAEAELQALVGRTFPGGTRRIEHWENFLLTEATGSGPMPADLAHPIHLFHVPIDGVGVSIGELFALGQADDDGAISIDYYDWQIFQPLREGIDYSFRGHVADYERSGGGGAPIRDSFTFCIELELEDTTPIACVTFRWHYWRFASSENE